MTLPFVFKTNNKLDNVKYMVKLAKILIIKHEYLNCINYICVLKGFERFYSGYIGALKTAIFTDSLM